MDSNLKRIILISIVNGIALYYINRMMDKADLLPQKKEQTIK